MKTSDRERLGEGQGIQEIDRDVMTASDPDPHPVEVDNNDKGEIKSGDYGIAKVIAKIISFTGWMTLFAGFVVVGYAIAHSKGYENIDVILVIILPGIGMIVTGLFLIVAGQITRATVDNATHNKHILMLLTRMEENRGSL